MKMLNSRILSLMPSPATTLPRFAFEFTFFHLGVVLAILYGPGHSEVAVTGYLFFFALSFPYSFVKGYGWLRILFIGLGLFFLVFVFYAIISYSVNATETYESLEASSSNPFAFAIGVILLSVIWRAAVQEAGARIWKNNP